MSRSMRRTIAATPLAAIAAFPRRALRVLRYDAKVVGVSARWLVSSREHHNYTYDLTPLNREHLAWFVATACQAPIAEVRGYLDEITSDEELREHVRATTAASPRRGLADRQPRFGRRIGWYAMVRASKPAHVVETGVDKGLGTVVIASALLRNGEAGHPGRISAIDINREAGYLVRSGRWASVVDLCYGDAIEVLRGLDRPVNLFLHDSDHRPEYERLELAAVEPHLAPGALLLSDNVTKTKVLPAYAERTGRQFLAFTEVPAQHWYPGDGIGAAWPRRVN